MAVSYFRNNRPWGFFEQFTKDEPSTVKIVTVNKNQSLSLQLHHHREEYWFVLDGEAEVTINGVVSIGKPGDSFFVPKNASHRLAAKDKTLRVLEIAFGQFDESDIVRLEDRYGRAPSVSPSP